jgi:hypothetical protein
MKKKIWILLMLLVAGSVAYLVYGFINRTEDNPVTGAPDARAAWVDVLSKCATTELLGSDVFYFGASNTIGPGSVWRKDSDGSLRLRFDLNELEPDPAKREAYIQSGNVADCSGQSSRKWQVSLGLPFQSQIAGVDATLAGELRKARDVTVGVTGWSANILREHVYEQLLKAKPEYGDEFIGNDRFVAENAILVIGFTSSFEFDKSAVGDVKGKVSTGQITLSNGTRLHAEWESGNKLRLTSSEPFYILAAIGQVSNQDGRFIFGKAKPVTTAALHDERTIARDDLLRRQMVLARVPTNAKDRIPVQVTNGTVTAVVRDSAEKQQVSQAASKVASETVQLSTGEGSPNVQGVQGNVIITVDRSTGKTETEKLPQKKP